MIKFSIKKILNYFGWSLIKINRKKPLSFTHGKPDINHIKKIINSSGILHLGAHRGAEAEVYNWFNKKVFWIEGYPEIYKHLKENLNNYYKQDSILALLGDKNEKVNFYVSNKDSSCSSIFDFSDEVKNKELWPELDIKMLKTIPLEMKKLDSVLLENHINPKDYNHWIIDLQGAELQALMGAKNSVKECKSIYIEISKKQYYEDGSTKWNDLKNYLDSLGFNLVNAPTEDHCEVLFEKSE
tara:strand:- start:76 stop:798 length:723 start_codon:yes stop_codon:yes gene_type:complete